MHTFFSKSIPFLFLLAFFALPAVADAQLMNPIAYSDISSFIRAVLKAVVLILFPMVVLMLVYTGFLFVKAQGKEKEISDARRAFFWTVIGGLIVLGAQALSMAIEATVKEIEGGTISTLDAPMPDNRDMFL